MAFPTTSVLDSFNRADGAPGANWTTEIITGYTSFVILSNTLAENVAFFGFDSDYWNPTTFGPDCEAYATIANKGTNNGIVLARIQSPNTGGVDAYAVKIDSFDTRIRKLLNGTWSDLGSPIATVIAEGDSFGIACVGTTIEAWHKPAAGSWTLLGDETDSDISAAGNIGLMTDSTDKTWAFDEFGGGSIGGFATVAWLRA